MTKGILSFFVVLLLLWPSSLSIGRGSDIPYQEGWPQPTGPISFSSPVVVDLDGDGDKEIVVASADNVVHVWHHDGTAAFGWPQATGDNPYIETSSPAVGDIDGDDDEEVVFGSEGDSLYAWHHDGTRVHGFPVYLGDTVIRSSATLFDVDGDGDLEIFIGTGENLFRLHAYHHDGTPLQNWPQIARHRVHSTPAVGDIDDDDTLEVVVGCDGSGAQGAVHAWDYWGVVHSGWPIAVGHHVDGSPALVDIDDDGCLEIFVGSIDNNLYGWQHTAENVDGWPQSVGVGIYEGIVSSPAIGDLDGDDSLEVVVGRGIIQSTSGAIFAFHQDGRTVEGFPFYCGSVTSSPAIGDLNADGRCEVVFGSQDGYLYALNDSGVFVDGFPLWVGSAGVTSSPAIDDIDDDGDVEILIGAENGGLSIWDLPGSYRPEGVPWGMFHHDRWHTGLHGFNGWSGVQGEMTSSNPPAQFALRQNIPNPCNSSTVIPYTISSSRGGGRVTLCVYNILGHVVRTLVDESPGKGDHHVIWDGRDDRGQEVASGVYFYRLHAGRYEAIRKLILMR